MKAAAVALERDPRVRYAEPNYLYRPATTPNDPRFPQLWGLHQLSDADIDAPEAWDVTTGSASIVVAVVDSGVAYNHPDLAPNIWTNDDPLGGGDNDGNGFADDTHGWDFFDGDAKPLDYTGHGTHVAGTIGAQGNDATGVVGVNWDVSVMPLRVGDAYGLDIASIVEAFHYAAANGARVVNGSFGGSSRSLAIRDMIAMHPSMLFVFAAGNDGLNLGSAGSYPCEEHLPAPAGGGLANVVCVAATDETDALAEFSNFGAGSVHLAAPGVGIVSSVPAYDTRWSDDIGGSLADFFARWGDRTSTAGDQLWTQNTGLNPSLTDSPASNYADNSDTSIRALPAIDLSGRLGCALDYSMQLAVQPPVGATFVDLFLITAGTSTAASTHTVAGWAGSTAGLFFPLTDDLSALDGQPTVYLRFRLVSDGSINLDGAYVDDLVVKCLSSTFDADDYLAFDGTSMATPHVAGVAALVLAANPLLTPTALKTILLANLDVLPGLTGLVSTGGRLNAFKAVSAADDPPPPPPPPPTPSLSVANAAPVLEGNSGTTNASFAVSLSAPSAETVTVNWNTANGSAVGETDFLTGGGPLTFSPGQTLKTVTVAVKGDTVDEPDETFAVLLSSPVNATTFDAVAQGTITDDDEPPAPPPPPIPSVSPPPPPPLPAGCTQAGTPGPDILRGTPGRDVICSLGGNDRIDGLGGNDVLFGGSGNDVLVGGAGRDTLWGEGGRDTLLARRGGKDTLLGGAQRDRGKWDGGVDRVRSVEVRIR